MVAMAKWEASELACQPMAGRPTEVRTAFTKPDWSANIWLKIRPTATGATT